MKTIYLIGVCALVLLAASCNEKPKETQTIIIEKEVEEKPVPVEEKRTTIKVGPDGGSVKTKDVDVEVKK
jgi:hypothetical protein